VGSWLADLGDRAADHDRGRVLGVLGASGGVGASVLALAVAEVAALEGPSLLVDLDPWGLPAGVLGGVVPDAGTEAVTWADLAELEGRVGARALRESLPARDGLRVLGWSPTTAPAGGPSDRVVREVLAAARGGHRWVVLDVPRSDSTRELLAGCDAVVVVAAQTLAGTAGAARVAGLVPAGVPAGVVVRTGRGALAEDLATLAGLPLWGRLRAQRGLDEHLAAGLGTVRSSRAPCARAARDVLTAAEQVVGGRRSGGVVGEPTGWP
jgi:secretion/DNA translocation related CpaE-like protein